MHSGPNVDARRAEAGWPKPRLNARKRIPDRVIDELVQVMVLEAAYAKGADVFRSASGSVLLNRSPVGV